MLLDVLHPMWLRVPETSKSVCPRPNFVTSRSPLEFSFVSPTLMHISSALPFFVVIGIALASFDPRLFFVETGGVHSWIDSTGWSSGNITSICSWKGLSCNAAGDIVELSLPGNGLNSSSLTWANICELKSLVRLDLSFNPLLFAQLPPFSSSECEALTSSLKELVLASAPISGDLSQINQWNSMPSLTVFNFASSRVFGEYVLVLLVFLLGAFIFPVGSLLFWQFPVFLEYACIADAVAVQHPNIWNVRPFCCCCCCVGCCLVSC